MEKMKVGIIVGSARKCSFSQKVADVIAANLPEQFDLRCLRIDNLALFNQDYDEENTVPEAWVSFRNEVREMGAYLFVTPEYNRSVPPALKNAIDIASRPYGQNNWSAKPAAVVSVSPGGIGGFGANHHLRQTLTFLNLYTMQQPEAYLSNIMDQLDEDGNLTTERTVEYLKNFASSFAEWITKFGK